MGRVLSGTHWSSGHEEDKLVLSDVHTHTRAHVHACPHRHECVPHKHGPGELQVNSTRRSREDSNLTGFL